MDRLGKAASVKTATAIGIVSATLALAALGGAATAQEPGVDYPCDYYGLDRGDNTFYGTEGCDVVESFGGDDVLYGEGGHDQLNGGNGVDELYGHAGDDHLYGGYGSDTVRGGSGDDRINGLDYEGRGGDRISCGEGDDFVFYDASDTVSDDCERREFTANP